MLKIIVALLGIIILGYALVSWASGSGAPPADPVTESATLDLKVKAQAGITVTVASLSNRMKQVMAAGNEPALRKAVDEDLAKLHLDVDAARTQLTTLGDSPAAVEQWLSHIGWADFQTLEAEYRKAGGQ
jgi:O-methyltransferase involved in polyketide biosynthesis